jgi:hypothetical protein
MSNPQKNRTAAAPETGSIFLAAVGLAVVLCLVASTLILLIPTQSINVDSVYQGF